MELAPGWYQEIVEFVSSGGTIVEAFAVVAGVTLPAWVGPVLAAFGLASA
ncbi:MAG: class IIc cyclic bacteriocin [Streptococcus mitis]|nr:class IIc cyclic bacteriocin [Streptococcus mitis]